MNIFIANLCLVLYIFTKAKADEVTTKIDPQTISNDAKSSDKGADPKLDLNVDQNTKDQTTKVFATNTPVSKFDMKDFKVTTLKSNHNEDDVEDCLAAADPKIVEAVRKTLKNDGGRVNYVASETLHDEELKIAACLKKENTMTTQRNTLTAVMKFDNQTATKTPLETVEEVEMKLEERGKKGRRDTEYQFDPLEYYDESVKFDPNSCPNDVDVIDLQIAELKQYDVECELLTQWIGLAETAMNMMSDAPSAKKQKVDDFTEDVDDGSFQIETDKFDNFVTPQELDRLSEFKVLDEVKSNDGSDEEEPYDDDDDGKSEGVPEEEIDKMLEEDLPEDFKAAPKPKEKPYITRQKIVLEEKGVNQFEVLPLDWTMVRHCSGMPVYMHRGTRVCTLAKPYSLGDGNIRGHDIPISAIPCLAYRRALEEEEKQKEIDDKIKEQIESGAWANKQSKHNLKNYNENRRQAINHTSKPNEPSIDEAIEQLAKEVRDMNEEIIAKDIKNMNVDQEDVKLECPDKHLRHNGCENVDSIEKNVGSNRDEVENIKDLDEIAYNELKETNKNEENADNETPLNQQPVILPGGIVMPPPRVETVNTSWKTQQLTHDQVNDYCKKLFKFNTVNVMHFKRWADRRKYAKARKTLQCLTLPEGTKLITIPAQPANGQDNGGKASKRDWVMNMKGRSCLSVFHEYVRRTFQKQPVYEFKELENASAPYQATVYIDGMQYGSGQGSSKRQAKTAAARASIHILIPEMRDEFDVPAPQTEPDFTFFDQVGIEDPRIPELCAASCEPSPHTILRTCLLRNFGAQDRDIHNEMKQLEHQKMELTMRVGRHSATVVGKNKNAAKQSASQAILQKLHPHVRSWGSLLRLYGSHSVKSCKEKKIEEQQITQLQKKARPNEPNYAVLEKLRNEMRKLKERDEAVVPIGTLLVSDDLPTHSGSNLNNVDL